MTTEEAIDYYHDLATWLSFPGIQEGLNKLVSGDEACDWMDHLRHRFGSFARCLSLSCGNGWVERTLFAKGVIEHVTGLDIDARYLAEAAESAAVLGMPCDYRLADLNEQVFRADSFDVVVNHAGLHHVRRLDRVMRRLCETMRPDAIFVSYDYVGAHRNQYSYETWSRVVEFDAQLPPELRNDRLLYPHMRTMLATDPSEAVHSELITEITNRYFEIDECTWLGGEFAYIYLHEHSVLRSKLNSSEGQQVLAEVKRLDDELRTANPANSLFSFVIARPKKEVLDDRDQLRKWGDEEDSREDAARQSNGRYRPPTALEIVYDQLAMANWTIQNA